jgi:hypothetical protein
MPRQQKDQDQDQDQPQYLDEDHQLIAEFADRFFDDDEDDDKQEFVDQFMEKSGHERASVWALPADPGKAKDKDGDKKLAAVPQKDQDQDQRRRPSYIGRAG